MAVKNVGDLRVGLVLDKAGFQSGLASVGSTVTSFVGQLAALTGVSLGIREIVDTVMEFGKQETALNRIEAAMRRQGDAVGKVREQINALGNEFIAFGQREEAAWSGFQRLYQATEDANRAMELLRLSLGFATAQGEDAGQVAEAVARAFAGQDRQLKMLLMSHGLAAKSVKEFGDYEEIMAGQAADATKILSAQELAVGSLKAKFDDLKDLLGKRFTPALLGYVDTFNEILRRPWLAFNPVTYGGKLGLNIIEEYRKYAHDEKLKAFLEFLANPTGVTFAGQPKPSRTGGEGEIDGKPTPYGRTQRYQEVLFDRSRQDSHIEGMRREREATADAKQAYADYMAELHDWNVKQSPAFLGAMALTNLFGNTLVDAMMDFDHAFSNMGETLKRLIAELIAKILMLKALGWMEGAFNLAPGSLTGAPQAPKTKTEGGGVQPLGGGYTVNVTPHSSGTLYQILRGNRIEFSRFAEDTYTVGGQAVASR